MSADQPVAIVTGGAAGLGLAISDALAAAGATVVSFGRTRREDVPHRQVQVDVSSEDAVAAAMGDVMAELGRLDLVVCNAGISHDGTLIDQNPAEWRATFDINVVGTLIVLQAAARTMREAQTPGQIITVSSCVGSRVAPGAAAYSASKAAIEMVTKCAATELGRYGIRVNCIAPGYIDAGMGRNVAADPKIWDVYRKRIHARRLGDGREIGDAVAYLASPSASYVNGHVLEVNGGLLWA